MNKKIKAIKKAILEACYSGVGGTGLIIDRSLDVEVLRVTLPDTIGTFFTVIISVSGERKYFEVSVKERL